MQWRIDPDSERPLYRQIADGLREDMQAGRLRPGQYLPSERTLRDEQGVSAYTVRMALNLLRAEGVIETQRGARVRVRARPESTTVSVPPGSRITARPATEAERREIGAPEGTWVFVVVDAAGEEQIYPADRTVIETTTDEPDES